MRFVVGVVSLVIDVVVLVGLMEIVGGWLWVIRVAGRDSEDMDEVELR